MEFAVNFGGGWRVKATALLKQHGINVYNPCTDEGSAFDTHNFKGHKDFHQAKINNFKKFKSCMNDIAKSDLIQVASSDFVLAFITPTLGGGTPGEMTCARYIFDVPVIAVLHPECEIKSTSGWVMACCDKIYDDLETAVNHIAQRIKEDAE